MRKELEKLIKTIPDTYEDFEKWVLRVADRYEGYAEYIVDYIKTHKNATTSDVAAYEDAFLMKVAENDETA